VKILVFDEWIPWPLESGKKIRTFNLMIRLAKKFEIVFLSYANLPEEEYKVRKLEEYGIKLIPVKDVRTTKWTTPFYLQIVLSFLSREPFSSQYHIKNEYIDVLRLTLTNEKPDLVHCEWTNLAPFLEYVEDIPCIISSHNVESDIWKRLGKNGSNIFMRILGRSQAIKIERLERHWYPRADCCIAVSNQDMETISSYGANVTVVDNGVDIGYYDSYPKQRIRKSSIVFTASFDTFSNQDGAIYFIEEIYPLIKKEVPDVQVWLVGKNPPDKLKSYSSVDTSIHVTGTVEDVRAYIAQAEICIVPLRIGGGSRLKILEAMAMKKPVVSTTVGAEGLSVEHGKNIFLADTPESFKDYVIRFLRDQTVRENIAESGYNLVKERYDWENLAMKHAMIWNDLIISSRKE